MTRIEFLSFAAMSILGLFAGYAHATAEMDFWNWFQRNDEALFNFESDREAIFDQLTNEMHKVHPSLTFEFGPKSDGRREFVISADGIREAFPKVESLYAAAPDLSHWKLIRFRPRRPPLDVQYGGILVEADTVRLSLQHEGKKVGITVYLPNYTETSKKTYTGIAFLFLDHALGEYDVETRVGSIEVKSASLVDTKTWSLSELPKAFDSYL